MAIDRKHELLVLGTEAELRSGLAARLEPRDELLARFDRRHVDLVASHTAVPTERAATLHGDCKGGQLVSDLAMRGIVAPKITIGGGRADEKKCRASRRKAAVRWLAQRRSQVSPLSAMSISSFGGAKRAPHALSSRLQSSTNALVPIMSI